MFLLFFFCDACITCLRMSAVAVRYCCSSPEPDREPPPPSPLSDVLAPFLSVLLQFICVKTISLN